MMHTKRNPYKLIPLIVIPFFILMIVGNAIKNDQPKTQEASISYSEKALDKEVTTTTSLFELPVIQTTTKPKPKIVPRKIPVGKSAAKPSVTDDIWYRLAMCETGNKMDNPNTGNGFYGYFQFVLSTWRSVGGTGYPHQHSYDEQKLRAQILQKRSGWGQWPVCSKKIGVR